MTSRAPNQDAANPNQRTALAPGRPDRTGHASLEMTARYYHASEKALQAASQAFPEIGKANALPAAGAKMEAALAGLEGLTDEELSTVSSKVREIEAKRKNAHKCSRSAGGIEK